MQKLFKGGEKKQEPKKDAPAPAAKPAPTPGPPPEEKLTPEMKEAQMKKVRSIYIVYLFFR